MAKLNANTIVTNPDTHEAVVLYQGDAVPEWAADLVGEHLLRAAEVSYASKRVADLRDEIESRNEGRDEPDQIPLDGNKADLVAALEADDADNE